MAVFITHNVARALDYKLDFKEGRSYKCLIDYNYNGGSSRFTKGKIYKCRHSYSIPLDNGIEISQFNLISPERMFEEILVK